MLFYMNILKKNIFAENNMHVYCVCIIHFINQSTHSIHSITIKLFFVLMITINLIYIFQTIIF